MTIERDTADVVIIGAGVVGCALARRLARSDLSVLVCEATGDVGDVTSKANTAILHTGFDTVPGSLESTLVAQGAHALRRYAAAAGIALEETGALLVAWNEEQEAALEGLKEKAERNGYLAAVLLSAEEVRRREPNLGPGSRGGLSIPDEAVIDPWSVSLAFATEAIAAGARFRFHAPVTGVALDGEQHRIELGTSEVVGTSWLINAAGLGAGVIDGFAGHDDFTVTPRRGQLLVYDKLARPLLSSIILPVPTERTKGVLVSPTVWGNLLVGPTAEDLEDPTDTATTQEGIASLRAAVARLLPALGGEEITASYAGLRAATEHRDYQIKVDGPSRYVCVGGIRSTGLTASLAIAEHVAGLLEHEGLAVEERGDLGGPPLMPPLGERQLRPLFDEGRIRENPAYGRAVCHCEKVSEGEVVDALGSVIPARDLGALRRRTRAMNGRCQGFYCGGAVQRLLERSVEHPGEEQP